MDRRSFLGTMTAATLLTRRFGGAADDHKIDKIGVQLYTVRSEIAKDFDGSLAKVASIGYQEVELAGFAMKDGKVSYFNRSPQQMRAALDRPGLMTMFASSRMASSVLRKHSIAREKPASKRECTLPITITGLNTSR